MPWYVPYVSRAILMLESVVATLCFCCRRYLAVRLGLNVAVVKDVFGQQERAALDRLQPASLTQHYKFATHARHLSDAPPEDAYLVSQCICVVIVTNVCFLQAGC